MTPARCTRIWKKWRVLKSNAVQSPSVKIRWPAHNKVSEITSSAVAVDPGAELETKISRCASEGASERSGSCILIRERHGRQARRHLSHVGARQVDSAR